jgi:hypothetical protein
LAVAKRVVHDGREEVHRLDKGAVAGEAINAGVVGAGRTDQDIRIAPFR